MTVSLQLLDGGFEIGVGFIMTKARPMQVQVRPGNNTDGTPIEVKCNDFNNANAVAITTRQGGDADSRRFSVTANRIDKVMLEARSWTESQSWWLSPLLASVQLSVALETPKEAQDDCNAHAREKMPTFSPAGGMSQNAWDRLLKLTQKYEGPVNFMYNDRSSPNQLVTCGTGYMIGTSQKNNLVTPVTGGKLLKSYFVNPEGQVPSDDEMIADLNAASNLPRRNIPEKPYSNLYDFALVTRLRMPWPKVWELLADVMRSKAAAVRADPAFANFASYPDAAKVAVVSIQYGSWNTQAYPVLAPCKEAVKAQDWARAAADYKDPGWDKGKGQEHVALFKEAAAAVAPKPAL
jgi:hypothetical protein